MDIQVVVREIADHVRARPLPPAPRRTHLPETDDDDLSGARRLGSAEGQTFLIEYVDSASRPSTRRITVWDLLMGANGVPCLLAHCHERGANRQFRVDRIQCVVDLDGEVFSDVPAFMVENFGMSEWLARRKDVRSDRWYDILDVIRHDAVILQALARSDGHVVAEERDIVVDYLSRKVERNGVMLDDAEIIGIVRYADRLRPTDASIDRALRHIGERGPDHVLGVLKAAAAVVDADGRRHPREIALINAVAQDLIGVTIF